ncbi:hypothetical protein BH23ACT9_BH23ACT9_09510 [soil metagenome]
MPGVAELPRPARLLLRGTAVAALGLAAAALATSGGSISWLHATVLALGIVLGELFRVDFAQRGGGTATFGLSDAALTAGLLVAGPAEVVIGAFAGVAMLQLVERVSPIKFAMNVAQCTAGAAAAALAVHALSAAGGAIEPRRVAAAAIGMTLFLGVNALTVGGMIAFTSGRTLRAALGLLLPTGGLLALGDFALGVVAVLLYGIHPWALPALAVPLALMWTSSRQEVHARVDRDRGAAFVEVEHALGAATTPDAVLSVLAGATSAVLGCHGAVWREGRWATPVPQGSTACPVEASLATPLFAPGATLGVNVDLGSVAIGLGGAVLVAWPGELRFDDETADWMGRLARSGRVHMTRATGAVALETERATLGAVVDGTGDGVMLLDPDGTVAVWNPAMARLSGIAVDHAVGRRVTELLGEGLWLEEGVHDVTPPSTASVWRIAVAAVEDVDVAAAGTLSVIAVHDVTAERQAARARDDMLAVVSHELRTPLTPIIASVQMLRRRSDRLSEDQRAELLMRVQDRADHLARLIDDLLLVGQLTATTSREPKLAPQPIDVGELVAEAVSAMRLARPEHRLSVRAGDGPTTRTDPVRLRQILDNLLDNACKFSEPGSPIEVAVTAEPGPPDRIAIHVSDQGRGIPPGYLDTVCDQFVRVEDPLVMTTSGAGLGLFIVRELTDLLGGTLSLDSQLGLGTTVSVRLPRLDTGDGREALPTPASEVSQGAVT